MCEICFNKKPYWRKSMSCLAAKQFHEELSLKNILTTILENLGVSKKGTVDLISLLDTHIELIIDKNDSNLFKFKNTEINFDFGEGVNEKITSSHIMIYLNDSLELRKLELYFINSVDQYQIIAEYNNDFEFINFKYDDSEHVKEQKKLIKMAETQRKEKIIKAIVDGRIEKNKIIINALKEKLHFLIYSPEHFEYVCTNYLLTGAEYVEWKVDNQYTFTISYHNEGNLMKVQTNIFRTGITDTVANFTEKAVITFNKNMKIESFQFILKKVKIGQYCIHFFNLDKNFEVESFKKTSSINKKIIVDECNNVGLSLKDYSAILKLQLPESLDIYETLPEINIPSAYDFNSEDFKKRLLIAEMLLF